MAGETQWLPSALRFGDEETIALTSGVERQLSDEESRALLLSFTGALSAQGVARLPSLVKGRHYAIKNGTTNGYSVNLRGPTGTTGVTIAAGDLVLVAVDRLGALAVVGAPASSTVQTQLLVDMANAAKSISPLADDILIVRTSVTLTADRTLTISSPTPKKTITIVSYGLDTQPHSVFLAPMAVAPVALAGAQRFAWVDITAAGGPVGWVEA